LRFAASIRLPVSEEAAAQAATQERAIVNRSRFMAIS
jgi:hypothetical protein